MTALSVAHVYNTVTDGVARAWRRWIGAGETADMECCAKPQLERMAQDIGVSISELHRLSRLGPDAADLLPKRMAALGLDRAEVGRIEPAVLHDMQRVCALLRASQALRRRFGASRGRQRLAGLLPQRRDAQGAERDALGIPARMVRLPVRARLISNGPGEFHSSPPIMTKL